MLFIIVSLIVLLVLCCTGRVTCILPHAFLEKNTSKTSIQHSNDKHENRKSSSENGYRIYKCDGRTTSYQLKTDNQFRNASYSVFQKMDIKIRTNTLLHLIHLKVKEAILLLQSIRLRTKKIQTAEIIAMYIHNRGYYDTNW